MLYLFVLYGCSYGLLLLCLIIGWRRRQAFQQPKTQDVHLISVLIPARNEEKNILFLLRDLAQQQHVAFEVIVIDDHSDDETVATVQQFIAHTQGNFRIIRSTLHGKKHALTQGVECAKGSVIVTTDADCRVSSTWLSTIHIYFQQTEVKMAFGGVTMQQGASFFHDLQAIEFSSLIGSAAASAALGFPMMCNGANVAFRKSVFNEVGGYEENIHIPSGDDEFLMRKIAAHYANGIYFVRHEDAVVTTEPCNTVAQFIHQRLRWAGKWRHNTSVYTVLLAVYVFSVQIITLICFGLLFFADGRLFASALSFLVMKVLLEYVFLRSTCKFLRTRWNSIAFIALQFIYPLYVTGIGIFAHFLPQRWKGRPL
jgi:cellulose synthase/poly-beta-1,6-N-acetylglucosamine synthase-like glycosyltransferase